MSLVAVIVLLAVPVVLSLAVVSSAPIGRWVAERRALARAARAARDRPQARRWLRPVVMTVVGWIVVTAAASPLSPALAVWLGGAVVGVGSAWLIRILTTPPRMDDDAFDRALRELLDQY